MGACQSSPSAAAVATSPRSSEKEHAFADDHPNNNNTRKNGNGKLATSPVGTESTAASVSSSPVNQKQETAPTIIDGAASNGKLPKSKKNRIEIIKEDNASLNSSFNSSNSNSNSNHFDDDDGGSSQSSATNRSLSQRANENKNHQPSPGCANTSNNMNSNMNNSNRSLQSIDLSTSHRRRKSRQLDHSDSRVGLHEIISGDLKNPNLVRIEVPLGKPIEEVYEGVHDGPVLGSGISGIVRLVTHRKTGVKYAVKCLDLALIDSEEGLKQLKEEIYIMCQLVSRVEIDMAKPASYDVCCELAEPASNDVCCELV